MKLPARILRANGLSYDDLGKIAQQSDQYISMQLNGKRPMTRPLVNALTELLPREIADQLIISAGEE